MKKRFFRKNKGSITLYVLVAILFFIILIFSAFSLSQIRREGQDNEYKKIKEEYERSGENLLEKYNEILEGANEV